MASSAFGHTLTKLEDFIKVNELQTKTVREIALEYPQTTRIFEDYKIDYCCGGRRPLAEAVAAAGVILGDVESRLSDAIDQNGNTAERMFPEKLPPIELVNYICETHHKFTREALDRLAPLMDKVCDRHGESHKELFLMRSVFQTLADDLIPHMRKEEMVLFPHIETISASSMNGTPYMPPPFMTVRNPIRMMMMEHDTAGDLLRQIREYSNDFALPEGACPSFKALYYGLEELEQDLHRHIHLENNVLFPQAEKIESEILGQ